MLQTLLKHFQTIQGNIFHSALARSHILDIAIIAWAAERYQSIVVFYQDCSNFNTEEIAKEINDQYEQEIANMEQKAQHMKSKDVEYFRKQGNTLKNRVVKILTTKDVTTRNDLPLDEKTLKMAINQSERLKKFHRSYPSFKNIISYVERSATHAHEEATLKKYNSWKENLNLNEMDVIQREIERLKFHKLKIALSSFLEDEQIWFEYQYLNYQIALSEIPREERDTITHLSKNMPDKLFNECIFESGCFKVIALTSWEIAEHIANIVWLMKLHQIIAKNPSLFKGEIPSKNSTANEILASIIGDKKAHSTLPSLGAKHIETRREKTMCAIYGKVILRKKLDSFENNDENISYLQDRNLQLVRKIIKFLDQKESIEDITDDELKTLIDMNFEFELKDYTARGTYQQTTQKIIDFIKESVQQYFTKNAYSQALMLSHENVSRAI